MLSGGRSSALAMMRSEQHQCVRFDAGNSFAFSIAAMASAKCPLCVICAVLGSCPDVGFYLNSDRGGYLPKRLRRGRSRFRKKSGETALQQSL